MMRVPKATFRVIIPGRRNAEARGISLHGGPYRFHYPKVLIVLDDVGGD
jgi:hypothetical protein